MDSHEVWRRLFALMEQLLDDGKSADARRRFRGLGARRQAAARRELQREWQDLWTEVARLRIGVGPDAVRRR